MSKVWLQRLYYGFGWYTEEGYSQEQFKELWAIFGDISMNPVTEEIEEAFLCYPAGTPREEIWHWFDQRYNGGVYKLLYKFDEVRS